VTSIPTPACPTRPDAVFDGAGQIALQCGGSIGGIFRFDPASRQFHFVGPTKSPFGAGLAVDPDDPSRTLIDYGVRSLAANVESMDPAGISTAWASSSLYTPVGGAFSPVTRDYWVSTAVGKLLRFRHGDHGSPPDVYGITYNGSAMGTGMGMVFTERGDLYISNGGALILKVSAEALAAGGASFAASLAFTTTFYGVYDLAYDGHDKIFGLCLIGPGYGGVMRFQLSNGSASFLKTDLAPFYQGPGNALGQGQAISFGTDGYLWVMQAPVSNPYPGLAQIDPVSGAVLQVVPLPAVVDGMSMGVPAHMAVLGLRLPHPVCPVTAPTSVATPMSVATAAPACSTCDLSSASLRPGFKEDPALAWLAPDQELIAVPNPNHGHAVAAFRLPEAGTAHLTLVDLSGQVVLQLSQADLPAGESHLDLDLGSVAPGVYVLFVGTEGAFGPKTLGSFKVAVIR
jgi:hypothetical protein